MGDSPFSIANLHFHYTNSRNRGCSYSHWSYKLSQILGIYVTEVRLYSGVLALIKCFTLILLFKGRSRDLDTATIVGGFLREYLLAGLNGGWGHILSLGGAWPWFPESLR